jgi:NAD(P)-dependent dehydrogenase (short-subunit alcohol dehydrogenase family)
MSLSHAPDRHEDQEESNMTFAGKVAFVTGGAIGIGYAIAEALADAGAGIAIADIDDAAAHAAAARLGEKGVPTCAVTCDVAEPDSVEKAVARVVAALGGVDLLINNAGLHLPHYTKPVTELSVEKWRRLLDVNLLGIIHCAKACREPMRLRGGGVIVNIASMAAFKAQNAYGISKLAVRGLTVALAGELGDDGIRVCGVAPGFVDSDTAMREFPEERRLRYVNEVQFIKRQGHVQDIANAVRFLCSDEASFVTADTLLVSGGALPRI